MTALSVSRKRRSGGGIHEGDAFAGLDPHESQVALANHKENAFVGHDSRTHTGFDEPHDGDVCAGSDSDTANRKTDNQFWLAVSDETPNTTNNWTSNQNSTVVLGQTRNGSATTMFMTEPTERPLLADPFLALAADVLDDAETNRIANENRLRQLTRNQPDKDGIERGFGLDETHPDVARLAQIVDTLTKVEHQAELNLKRMLRKHPLGPWIKNQKGIGDKQAARLLAVIGDPCHRADGTPRTIAQLRAYCGVGDPNRRPFKGMTQDDLFTLGNPKAKSRLWLIACACLKAQGHYADVYYDRKAKTEDRPHARECVRCGPSGHPAPVGSPWSAAHRHADALRVVGKVILRDLWVEARRIHEEATP